MLSRLVRYASIAALAGFAVFALLLLVVRFVVFPQVDAYRDTLTAALAKQIGLPVEIAALTTGWDGWNPKIAIKGFRVRGASASDPATVLDLPEVDLIVAWTSLPLLDLRLKELAIDRPRLSIRRDRAGMLHVAGVEIDPELRSGQTPLFDWILRQPQIVVRDALILWEDDLREAPQLVLDRVQFRLENRFGKHRFGFRGTPPPELAAPIDVRGEVTGASITEWQKAEGRLYVRLDYADFAAWREWLPLPIPIARGQGAMRIWSEFAQGELQALTADLELADVNAKLASDLPDFTLSHLSGRAGWRFSGPQREFFARQLAFDGANGRALAPTDFTLTLRDATGGGEEGGLFEFDRLELEPLRDVAAQLPLPDRIRAELARFAPRGTLARGRAQWLGPADSPRSFSASAEFNELGFDAQDAMPGVRGASGSFNATQLGGDLKLDARNAVLELPGVFVSPIAADVVRGTASWERVEGQTTIRIERLEFSNPDAAGTAAATYRTRALGPGDIDLNARLDRANPQRVWYYLPKQVHESTREWLRTGLLKGAVGEAKLKLTGDLAAFPFADGKGGQFLLTAKTRDLTLAYADRWPAFTDLDGEVRFEGARLTIDAVQGHLSGAQLGRVRAEIPDLRSTPPLLKIGGDFSGPMADFAQFINGSPLAEWTGHFLEGAEVTGTGQLALKLDLQLGKAAEAKVDGELTMSNARLDLPGVPAVSQANGKLAFTERELHARDLAVDIFGGPAKLTIERTDGRLGVTGAGTANLASLRREYPVPYSDRASGSIDWTIAMNARPDALSWVLESALKGVAIDLPAPLGKSAAETIPLRVERRQNPSQPGEDTIVATYGKDVALALHRKLGAKGADVDRVLVSLGRAAERPDAARADRSGLWLRAEMPSLNADTWLALQRREPAAAANAAGDLEFQGADLDVGVLEVLGRRFNALKVTARRDQRAWRLDLRGSEIAGTATWSAPDAGAANGRIVARLARLSAPAAGELALTDAGPDAKPQDAVANSWPDIDLTADSFMSKGRDLGRLEVIAQPRGAEWRIEKLVLANDAGRIDAEGAWRALGRQQQTRLDVVLDVKESGAFLTRFGLPDAVQGAPTRIEGQLSWTGAPSDFDYPTLAGAFRINSGAGRFMKVEPGIGKLLGVLSLQALPRRMTLDFKDIFSDGFAFDQVTGSVRIRNGVMTTDNLSLAGPAAKVDIAGDADLAKETQRLSVKVQPALSMSISTGAALLFLANPIIGAAVGAGSLLAQKVLQDPLEQLFSYQYVVTGGWSDPIVTRSNRDGTATVANPSAEDAVTR